MSKELDSINLKILTTPCAGELVRQKAFRFAAKRFLMKLVDALGVGEWQYALSIHHEGESGAVILRTDFVHVSVSQDFRGENGNVLVCPCTSRHMYAKDPGQTVGYETLADTESMVAAINRICGYDVREGRSAGTPRKQRDAKQGSPDWLSRAVYRF